MSNQKLKKQQKLLYLIVPLTALMAAMKYAGLFSVGDFPPFVEAGISVVALIVLVVTSIQIRKLESTSAPR